jgi:hypothetical protein
VVGDARPLVPESPFAPNEFNNLKGLTHQILLNVAEMRKRFATCLHAPLPLPPSCFQIPYRSNRFESNRAMFFSKTEVFFTPVMKLFAHPLVWFSRPV